MVSTAYDPMLGKVIVHGPDRECARRALVAALDDTAILGLTTNTGFLRALAASDEFRDATIDTAWLDHADASSRRRATSPGSSRPGLGAMLVVVDQRGTRSRSDGWRLGAESAPIVVELDETLFGRPRGRPGTRPRGRARGAQAAGRAAHRRARSSTAVASGRSSTSRPTVEVVHRGQRFVFERPDVFGDQAVVGDGAILAPMPGTVLDVRVTEGQAVDEGDVLGVMEAMKMELTLKAPFAGTVTEVDAAAGEQVDLGARLFWSSPQETSD